MAIERPGALISRSVTVSIGLIIYRGNKLASKLEFDSFYATTRPRLLQQRPQHAMVLRDGAEICTATEELAIGDLMPWGDGWALAIGQASEIRQDQR